MTRDELADAIAKDVLEELEGRKGFKHLLEEIELSDPETYEEIKKKIAQIADENITVFVRSIMA